MSMSGKWAISTDEERYHGEYDSKEDAISEAMTYNKTCWVGQCVAPTPPEDLFNGYSVERWIDNDVFDDDDYSGEWAEHAVSATREQMDQLAALIRPIIAGWLDFHKLRPTHWNIDPTTVEEVKMEDEPDVLRQ